MRQEELTRLVEAYREGSIDREDSEKLAQTIRSGDQNAEWVMDELAFSGWISQALDDVDDRSFMRSFIERLVAEEGAEAFTHSDPQHAQQYRSDAGRRAGHGQHSGSGLSLWQLLFSRREKAGRSHSTREKPPRRRLLFLPIASAVLAAAVCVVAVVYYQSLRHPKVGVIEQASAGVILRRSGEVTPVQKTDAVRSNDTLRVPSRGTVQINRTDRFSLELRHSGVATFMPADYPTPEVDVPPRHGIFLAEGEMAGTFYIRGEHGTGVPVVTPHAVITPHQRSELTITVSSSASRLEVHQGQAELKRNSDNKTLTLTSGKYATAGPEQKLTAKRLAPRSGSQ